MDVDTAVVSDRKGSIAVLSCADNLEGKINNFQSSKTMLIGGVYVHELHETPVVIASFSMEVMALKVKITRKF